MHANAPVLRREPGLSRRIEESSISAKPNSRQTSLATGLSDAMQPMYRRIRVLR